MSPPYGRIYNFSAGPGTLPVPVLEECRDDLVNYKGTGMSIMEMSHRSAAFEGILAAAKADLRALLAIPENYDVLFLPGGASLQFTMVALGLLAPGQTADYVVTGAWGKKAVESAQLEASRSGATVNVVWDGKADNFRSVPDFGSIAFAPDAAYIHFTSNETIQGVQFATDPVGVPTLVCDMSSDILSRPMDVAQYGLIYAGAQKNMGPAGTTVVIVRRDLLPRGAEGLPPMLDYRVHASNDSMYNTPACWSIYVCGLVYRYLLDQGGLSAAAARNRAKADVLYTAIDDSDGFYRGHAHVSARSVMNVTFTLADDAQTGAFIAEAESIGLDGLKGHRSVGGCRASIYNAFPLEGAVRLAEFMTEFARRGR